LKAYVEITEESTRIQKLFDEFCEKEEYKSEPWLVCMMAFAEDVLGMEYVNPTYTYNFDNLLDHDIQSIMTYYDNEAKKMELDAPIILLQVHLGADARGGLTRPRIFTVKEPDYFILAMSDLDVQCNKCGMEWYSDDCGYSWHYGGCNNSMKPLDGERDEELKTSVDEDKNIRHKGCGGQLSFYPRLFY
jgi:hypothetical protein